MSDLLTKLHSFGLEWVVQQILSLLDQTDLSCCQLVNKAWHEHVSSLWIHHEQRLLWHNKEKQPSISIIQCTRSRSVSTISNIVMDEQNLCIALCSSGLIELYERRAPHKIVWSLKSHCEGVYALDMDCSKVISGGDDNLTFAIKIFSRDSGNLLHQLLHHEYIVWRVVLKLNCLFTFSHDCSILKFLFDNDNSCPKLTNKWKGPSDWSDALFADCSKIVTLDEHQFDLHIFYYTENEENEDLSNNDSYKQFDLTASPSNLTLRGHETDVNCVKFYYNLLFSADAQGKVLIWDLNNEGECLRQLSSDVDKIWCLDVDHYRLVVGGRHGTIKVWRLSDCLSDSANDWSEKGRFVRGHATSTAVGQGVMARFGFLSYF